MREKLALPYRSGAEAKAARLAQWCGDAARLHARDRAAGARTRDRRPPGPPATGCLRFYEEIRDELERTPTSEGAKAGLLAAALDRCRRSTSFGIAPAVVQSEFKAVIGLLTGPPPEPPPQGRPQLRIIQGGLG